jgi:hypothetical protein
MTSRSSSVMLNGYGLNDLDSISGRTEIVTRHFQTCSGAHPASSPVGTGGGGGLYRMGKTGHACWKFE